MPRAGRPERPLVTSGPVSQLAGELRLMRHRAKLTYGQLAEKTGLSAATLRTAAAGTRRADLESHPCFRKGLRR